MIKVSIKNLIYEINHHKEQILKNFFKKYFVGTDKERIFNLNENLMEIKIGEYVYEISKERFKSFEELLMDYIKNEN